MVQLRQVVVHNSIVYCILANVVGSITIGGPHMRQQGEEGHSSRLMH